MRHNLKGEVVDDRCIWGDFHNSWPCNDISIHQHASDRSLGDKHVGLPTDSFRNGGLDHSACDRSLYADRAQSRHKGQERALGDVGAGMELDALSNLGRRADQLLLPCIEFVVVLINVVIFVVVVLIIILVIIFLVVVLLVVFFVVVLLVVIFLVIILLILVVVATSLAAPPFAPFATTLILTAGCIDS
jgi:hypothetical protein